MPESGPQLSFEDKLNDDETETDNGGSDEAKPEIIPEQEEVEIPGDPFGRKDPRYKDTDRYKDARYG